MNRRLLLHIGFWLFYTLYNGYLSVPLSGTTFADLTLWERLKLGYLAEMCLLPIKVPAVYFVLYYVIPKSFIEKKRGIFLLQFISVAAVVTFISRHIWFGFIYENIYQIEPPKK